METFLGPYLSFVGLPLLRDFKSVGNDFATVITLFLFYLTQYVNKKETLRQPLNGALQ